MRVAITAAVAALALPGCRAEAGDQRTAGSAAAPGAVTPVSRDSLALELLVPAETRAGAPVRFVVRLANRGSRPLDLYLRGRGITVDVEVTRPDGAPVWRRLEGEIIPAIVHLRTLAPAERLEVAALWNQRAADGRAVEPGDYAARGLVLTEDTPLATATVRFRITAP